MKKIKWSKNDFVSQKIFESEIKKFFSPSPFLGLTSLINDKKVFVVDYLSDRYLITKTDKYNLLLNKCIHKNAKLIENSSEVKKNHIICPIHFWCYDFDGKLKTAPLTDMSHSNEKLSIESKSKIFEWQGFLFSNSKIIEDMKSSKFLENFDFSKYKFVSYDKSEQIGNWKEYAIVFNDSHHVKFFHPEMSAILHPNKIEWELKDNFVVHRMNFIENWEKIENNRYVEYFNELKKQNLSIFSDGKNEYAVTWMNIFPNVFLDIWSQQINITFVEPISAEKYRLHNFWLCDENIVSNEKLIKIFSQAIDQVEAEDLEIIDRIHKGISSDFESEEITEWIIDPLESGDFNFYEWLVKNGEFYKSLLRDS